MARRKKRPLSKQQKRRRRERQTERQDDVVHDTAATFTCAAETAGDFAYQCTRGQEELELDLLFNRLALEIWTARPGPTQALVAALEELLSERLRHRETLAQIGQRLENLAADPSFHIHLDPPEAYRELVRSRLFPEPPPK